MNRLVLESRNFTFENDCNDYWKSSKLLHMYSSVCIEHNH